MRIALGRVALLLSLVLLVASIAGVLAGSGRALQRSGAGVVNPPLVGTSQYVVRNDPRLCPSPLCGGYWVALANRSRTRCSDGGRRPRCYVARAVDEDRHPLTSGMPEEALVRADIESWTFQGFGELGTLVVADVRGPTGKEASGAFYRVRDLGIRCIRAPCFSSRAARINGTLRVALSGVDLSATGATSAEEDRALAELTTKSGLFVLGKIVVSGDGGRTLRASRFYLRGTTPRA